MTLVLVPIRWPSAYAFAAARPVSARPTRALLQGSRRYLGGLVRFDELLGRDLHAVALPVGARQQEDVPNVRLRLARQRALPGHNVTRSVEGG